ncbi:MAG TPA: A/G-specific adenine glycosylase [Candidatus Deferrimicrobium sp.]|nr:A/G-specific adenine glycosylase [Candidatus Deferrimicrobium sp.]
MDIPIEQEKIHFFQNTLILWFKKYGRDLPWRKTRNPYHILISELMLQQTQVIRVEKEYYFQFLNKFPSIQDLANASEEDVLKAWEGLGYYNRAKNLHKIAQMIVSNYDGKFPEDYNQIINLPGIGKYTAGAILSFAFERDFPIVDTNVERIVKRIFLYKYKIPSPAKREKTIWQISEQILLKRDAWTFNQAILDFGALICIAQKPRCAKCPMRPICQYFQSKISKKGSIVYWTKSPSSK